MKNALFRSVIWLIMLSSVISNSSAQQNTTASFVAKLGNDRSKDIATIPLEVKKATQQTDQFTIAIEPNKVGGLLKFVWDETEASTSFKVVRKNK